MGLDKISARMLKETVSSINYTNDHCSLTLHVTFNRYLSWQLEVLSQHIPKSGDSSNPGNYRLISLLLIVSKLLEKHICDLLCEHLDISDQQWGFQACKSTTNAILSATNEWFIHLENGAEVQAVFFDFQKSFNSVPHCLLIDKLHQLETSRLDYYTVVSITMLHQQPWEPFIALIHPHLEYTVPVESTSLQGYWCIGVSSEVRYTKSA